MTLGSSWIKCAYTTEWFARDLRKYGHLLKFVSRKEDMLEVGCANGLTTRTVTYPYVRDHLNKLLGIDIDESMVDAAREHDDIDKIKYRQMDVMNERKVEEMKGKFHKIFVPLVAHLILDNRVFLQRLHMMLQPGGQIFLTTMVNTPMHYAFSSTQIAWSKYLSEEVFFHDYTTEPENYFTDLATNTGFRVQVCQNQKLIESVENVPEIIRVALTLFDRIRLIPKELQEDYYQEHLRKWSEVSPDKYQCERMVCVASKTK